MTSQFRQLLEGGLRSPPQLAEWAQVLRAEPEYQLVPLTAKMWVFPDGTVQPLGGQLHDTWLQDHPQVAERLGLTPEELSGSHQEVRIAALKHGLIRVAYERANGRLTIEGLYRHLRGEVKRQVFMLVADNLSSIDSVTVNLMDETAEHLIVTKSADLFAYDDDEKLDHLPQVLSETEQFRAVIHGARA